jgi:UDP-N-acetylmuramate--alanine ligase
MDEIYEAFETFVGKVVPGGTLVISADQQGAVELASRVRDLSTLKVVTYGEAESADVRIHKITARGLAGEVTVVLGGRFLTFAVSVPGSHNAHNAVAALAAGVALGIPAHNLASALGTYTGVKRRLQLKGEAAGVQVIDSYAHHPTEMTADLEAMRAAVAPGSRILVVFQPHLFSRTQELATEMGRALALADASVVLDIYPAREDPVPGVTSALIVEAAEAAGAEVRAAHDKNAVPGVLAGMAGRGDLVLTMGAGDVTDLGPHILARLNDPA